MSDTNTVRDDPRERRVPGYVSPRILTLSAREVLDSLGAPSAAMYDRVDALTFA